MALTRKFLSALGIEADKIDEIIEAHTETTNALKAERDELKASADKLATVQKELEEAKATIEASKGEDAFKVKYEAILEEFKSYKAQEEAKALTEAKDKAYRQILRDAGISEKRIDSIVKVTDIASLEMDGDKLKDAEALTTSAKEEWADFIVTTGTEGANTQNPPASENGNKPVVAMPSLF